MEYGLISGFCSIFTGELRSLLYSVLAGHVNGEGSLLTCVTFFR